MPKTTFQKRCTKCRKSIFFNKSDKTVQCPICHTVFKIIIVSQVSCKLVEMGEGLKETATTAKTLVGW